MPKTGLQLIAFLILTVGGSAARTPDRSLPTDFRVVVHFVSGDIIMGNGKIWDLSVTSDGVAEQKVESVGSNRAKIIKRHVSHTELLRPFQAVEKFKFFQLPSHYPAVAYDCPPLILTVTARGRSHKVVYAPCERTEPSARCFERIWEVVLRVLAPSELRKT